MSTEHHAHSYPSLTPPKLTAIAAIAVAGLGMLLFMIADTLHVFKPCRMLYRTPNPIENSLLCDAYTGLEYLGMALFLVFVVLITISGIQLLRQPAAKEHTHEH
jgi:hypothetical protein